MATYDLSEFLGDGVVVLDGIRSAKHPDGKSYRFASPSFEVGLWLHNLMDFGRQTALGATPTADSLEKLTLDDGEELDLYKRVMGATLDEMRADDLPWASVQKVFGLLLRHWGADQAIDDVIRGEAPGPANRAERRAAKTSSRKAGSNSSRASTGTRARTTGRTSTRSSATSASKSRAAG